MLINRFGFQFWKTAAKTGPNEGVHICHSKGFRKMTVLGLLAYRSLAERHKYLFQGSMNIQDWCAGTRSNTGSCLNFVPFFFQSLETVGAQRAEEDESRATEVLEVFNLFSSIFRQPIYFSVCALREYYWEQSRTFYFAGSSGFERERARDCS